ncbi:hypothetical protein [Actinomadura alba]|uniref:Uncharacterized protein n=1 Tax=Actinomadura alba TaxID=406431 RepID=A0ABR7LY11_9ACTN|nr:hypothetical protein [Actinomadura alba]MBC6469578.1 hypothetical protein [Actinomadura alba]
MAFPAGPSATVGAQQLASDWTSLEASAYCRVTVEDTGGKRAWSNPIPMGRAAQAPVPQA